MAGRNDSYHGLESLKDAAISRLHPDLLWLIFMMNSEIPPSTHLHERLATARATSQVCRQWREMVLRSSALWGKLIDLDLLHQPNWRDEVLSRTGDSLLWIQGKVSLSNREFFLTLLDQHWTRVQKLEVCCTFKVFLSGYQDLEPLYRPAPHLQTIKISVVYNRKHSESSYPSGTLFSDAAPNLREFGAPEFMFRPRAPWFSNICKMAFPFNFAVPDIFNVLEMMPLLEHLSVIQAEAHKLINPDDLFFPTLPQILLPRLTELKMDGQVHYCLPFLACLTPGIGCSLFASITPPRDAQWASNNPSFPTLLDATSQHMTKHIGNYFTTHTMTRATLECFGSWLKFSDISDPNRDENLSCLVDVFNLQRLSIAVLTALATPSFMKSVDMLFLEIRQLQPNLILPLISLLPLFHSVVNLETHHEALKYILDYFPDSSSVLPALHTITAHHDNTLNYKTQLASTIFSSFMKTRKDAGCPVSVFDLTQLPIHRTCDMDLLEELTGLVVKWTQDGEVREYLCGIGSPHQLKFSQISTPTYPGLGDEDSSELE